MRAVAAVGLAVLQASGFAVTGERATGEVGLLDWLLVGLAGVAVLVVIVLCVRHFLWPGEDDEGHVKRRVLQDRLENP